MNHSDLVIHQLIENIARLSKDNPQSIIIVHGHSLQLDRAYIKQQFLELSGLHIDIGYDELPIQLSCEWCGMISQISNHQLICHYCGKESDIIANDYRCSIKLY